MAAPTLDRSKNYATVSGCTEGRTFAQGEHFFRADGSLWVPAQTEPDSDPPALAKPAAKKAKPAADQAPAAVDDQLNAQMGAA